MHKTFFLLAAAVLATSPMAFGHVNGGPYGTPKPYCENITMDTNSHDYTALGGTAKFYPLAGPFDGNVNDCDFDGMPLDFDGHSDFAVGGAFLLATDTPPVGNGATACYGESPHHPMFPNVWVFDHLIPFGIMFIVAADSDLILGNFCGDGVADIDTGYCFDHCQPTFPAGLDGAYYVFVINEAIVDPNLVSVDLRLAALGHVYT